MDITPLDIVESEIWWGEHVRCDRCNTLYVVAMMDVVAMMEDEEDDWIPCKKCDTGFLNLDKKQKLQDLILGKHR